MSNNGTDYNETIAIQRAIIGEFVDTVIKYNDDGTVTETEYPKRKNDITVPVSTLVAGLIKGQYVGNNSFWAVGTGLQAQSPYLTNLVNEVNRKQVTISFVDNNNAISTTPTNRLVMNVNWGKGELGVVQLTEFGIFSGSNANTANGGLMIDYVPHGPITLDTTTGLARKIFFTF